ncbi:hypothetical protein BGZ80_011767 [Entomortierella chlamydospora]|uniref:Uncharacterized protein n=1 Tax=Entomortierella chlamydospora TaxID=101097 RepID=A0A9P6T489_9FUNG|nr:hypothetical protein BGZ79_003725 [Entomortierella chlamydospora]KAG0022555.1 hypothetical protein BGZ80_011767 [Entomortierella chlamydospora]
MSNKSVNKNRRFGAVVAYTTLACSLVSLGLYAYRRRPGARNNNTDSIGNQGNNRSRNSPTQAHDPRTSLDNSRSDGQEDNRSSEAQSSSLSRLGSKIARTVKRNRKVMTISVKNTIVWNPSPDPTTPNYGFVEGVIPLLFHLAENYNLHLILLSPLIQEAQQRQPNGKGREPTIQELDELKREQQLGQERDREQILTMLKNAGLIAPPGTRNSKLIDPRQLLVCETEEGVSHVVRHLESQVHVEALQSVLEMVQGVVPKVVFIQKRPGHSRQSSSARNQDASQFEDIMTRSHIRDRSSSRSSSSESEDLSASGVRVNGSGFSSSSSQLMGDSFVEVVKSASHTPLVSGYVTQAGRKGYVEVADQLMHSSLNPESNI